MSRTSFLIGMLLLGALASAAPVDQPTAQLAARHFLQHRGLLQSDSPLTHYKTVAFDDKGQLAVACYYVFNFASEGFVIVAADDRCTPIIGYSTNGAYADEATPPNMEAWMRQCAREIEAGIRANAPDDPETLGQWKKLLSDPDGLPIPAKSTYLLTSKWGQGSGYNLYCPTMNRQHVVVGCVATAMAQIIRFHRYPTRGFGTKTYSHSVYGILGVNFDTVDYDYSLMPDRIRYSSSYNEMDMTSRLNYHCGVAVNMNYQSASHSEGSGARSEDVAEGLRYFGYTDAKFFSRDVVNNDQQWIEMIKNEIDNRRPILYSGIHETEGGHAFVLDGYDEEDRCHFNWGWDGSSDGFYTLSTIRGFTQNQDIIINIAPSGWDGHLTAFHVSPDGHGDGTSWEEANSNLQAAVVLNSIVSRSIWLKEGTYLGDTSAEYPFLFTNGATLIGGFAGTETSANQRNATLHPSIFDGQGRRPLISVRANNSSGRSIDIMDITLQNGYSPNGACISLRGKYNATSLIVRNCLSDSGSIANISSGKVRNSIFEGNQAPVICQMDDAALRQCRLNNNNAETVLRLSGSSRVVNNTIASNTGLAVLFNHTRNSFINNIVWNNDTSARFAVQLADTCVRHCALQSDTAFADTTWLQLGIDNNEGPMFIRPADRGLDGLTDEADYHLHSGSPCIDAGTRLAESIRDGDLEGSLRCRNGFIDLGCYEFNPEVSITPTQHDGLRLYPNPANSHVNVLADAPSSIRLYDLGGRLLQSLPANEGLNRVDLNQLPQGSYFIQIGTKTARIVKQ